MTCFRSFGFLLGVVLVGACSGDPSPAGDSGLPDGAQSSDSAVPDSAAVDAATSDAMSQDASTMDAMSMANMCTPACAQGTSCVGDACSCILAIHGNTYLRGDGTVFDDGHQTVVDEGATGQPLGGVVEIFEGQWHGCALRSDKTVWCWPKTSQGNVAGQLGNGSTMAGTAHQATQVMVDATTPLTAVEQFNGGASRCYLASTMCAVRSDGTLWCWGAEQDGGGDISFFNDGSPNGNRLFPSQILAAPSTPLTGVDHVTLGRRHGCVLRSGEVWCWGGNVGGPLGQGDQDTRDYPVRVSLPAAAQQVGAGSDATCALVGDSVYCWGASGTGQIGIGDPSSSSDGCINFCRLTPAQVLVAPSTPLIGVEDLNMAYLNVCARRGDHSLWCWGFGVGNVAAPLMTAGGSPMAIDNVALHTTCGSSMLPTTIRYLTRDNQYRDQAQERTQVCP